ncbi:MAG TPA: NADP-dependent oxidoreductase [Reyranella sp.]|jgi:hypothetical protein
MRNDVNRQVLLKARPSGIPQAEHFELVRRPLPVPAEGQVLVRNIYLSVDPAMRGWVSAVANYSEPVPLGSVMRSIAAGRIVESRHRDWSAGDLVVRMFGWQDFAAVDESAIQVKVTDGDVSLSAWLGVLGVNGLTAYFGLLEAGQPRPSEAVVVSTAAGSVGSCWARSPRSRAAAPSLSRAARRRSPSATTPSATTPPSTTSRMISTRP